jgi:hypothetical protein
MPKLGNVAIPYGLNKPYYPFGTGLVIQTFGNPLDINLPSLSRANGIKLEGTINRYYSYPLTLW